MFQGNDRTKGGKCCFDLPSAEADSLEELHNVDIHCIFDTPNRQINIRLMITCLDTSKFLLLVSMYNPHTIQPSVDNIISNLPIREPVVALLDRFSEHVSLYVNIPDEPILVTVRPQDHRRAAA